MDGLQASEYVAQQAAAQPRTHSIAYSMWVNGRLMRGYIYAPQRTKRKVGQNEYLARIEIDGNSISGVARQDAEGKLYFVPSPDSKNGYLV